MKNDSPSFETQELRDFAETLQSRRTIELFLQTPVPDRLINDAIEAAVWAPNHHVTEPWHFYTLGDETKERCLDLCQDIVTHKVTENLNGRAGRRNRAGWW